MKNTKTIFCFLYLIIFYDLSFAGTSPGTDSLQFLKICVGARQTALADSSCVLTDANSVFSNPAAIEPIEVPSLIISHNQWLEGITQQSLAGTLKTDYGNLGFGVLYLHMDNMKGYDIDTTGNPVKISDFTSYDLAGVLSYNRTIKKCSAGISLKTFQEKIEDESAIGICLDLGLYRRINDLSFGVAVQNLGPKIKFIDKDESLPLNISIGAGCQLPEYPLLFVGNIDKPDTNDYEFSFGTEYSLKNVLDVRMGYRSANDNREGISAGIGIRISTWIIDYAYIPFGDLGDIHRISISTRLDRRN
ncbi:PorV/PorQ family protein [Elusimicrobiota bacterium]